MYALVVYVFCHAWWLSVSAPMSKSQLSPCLRFALKLSSHLHLLLLVPMQSASHRRWSVHPPSWSSSPSLRVRFSLPMVHRPPIHLLTFSIAINHLDTLNTWRFTCLETCFTTHTNSTPLVCPTHARTTSTKIQSFRLDNHSLSMTWVHIHYVI
jgi:hypothetical protein